MYRISKLTFSLLINEIVTNLRDSDVEGTNELDVSKIKQALEEGIMKIPNLEYSWGEPKGRISERLVDICFILVHLEKNMPVALRTYYGAFIHDLYHLTARCRNTKDFIERVDRLACKRMDFGAILFSSITYELGRLFNIAPFQPFRQMPSDTRKKVDRKTFDEVELEVYRPQLGVHAEPLRKMWSEGPSSKATLEITDEELKILEDGYWIYTTDLGNRKLHYLTPALVSSDITWIGADYLSQKNPSPDILNVDFIKLLKEISSDRIFEMERLPSRLFMLGFPQKIRFLDFLFEEEVLRIDEASPPYLAVESELLNHDVASGIAYIMRSFRNEICIKLTQVMNIALRHHSAEEGFFRRFYVLKTRKDLRKTVLRTSKLETFLVLSSLSPSHILAIFDELSAQYKELFLQMQLDKIAYRYPDLMNPIPLQELIEKLPSGYRKRLEETFRKIAFGNYEGAKQN